MSVKTRLMLSFGSLLLLMVFAAAIGWWGMSSINRQAVASFDGDMTLALRVAELDSQVLTLRRYEKDTFLNIGTNDTVASYFDKWQNALKQLRATVAAAQKLMPAAEQKDLTDFLEAVGSYEQGYLSVHNMIVSGAITTSPAANQEMTKYKDAIRGTENLLQQIKEKSVDRVAAVKPAMESKRHGIQVTLLTLTVSALVVAMLLAYRITNRIVVTLMDAMQLAKRVAAGELGHRQHATDSDEFGELTRTLHQMDRALSRVIVDMGSVAATVSSASQQIATGNEELSTRTQEQASSLEETAASMEEMTATVKQNADNTAHATELARRARGIADEGGRVVQQAIAAMAEINQSSRRIGDIIGVIDEIAFQTNLLALNAAVEAARAGEQGRGFAVVAAEVRNLAQRSAGAAKEIKSLIQDSTEKVQAGAQLVEQSGSSLAEIVQSTAQVATVVDEIAAANKEQSAGIMQINQVVTQMDAMTQRNAAAVEEVSAASKALQGQAELLAEHVRQFRVNPQGMASSSSSGPSPVTASYSAPYQVGAESHSQAA